MSGPEVGFAAARLGELSKAAVKCAMDESVREGRWEHLVCGAVWLGTCSPKPSADASCALASLSR
eukprot:1266328-Rhodomonas_salina.3